MGRAATSSTRLACRERLVSALVASSTEQDRVRELQRALYRAAKADPRRRFHALYDKLSRRDVLERAWGQVRANRGAAGIDRITLADVEQYGSARLLDELAADLRDGRYRPLPARRVFIPKPGSQERRPLAIPAIRDRIVQAAAKTVIEPIFEADFQPCSFGFRPRRTAHDALQVLLDESFRGRRWVVETDIASCFEAILHERLMQAIEERIVDRHLLKLLRAILRAGVMEEGRVRRSVSGTPQGGVISPLLCNVYLNRLDRGWRTRGEGVLCRYADDLVVMCKTKREAERALGTLRVILAELGLEQKRAKTGVVHLREGGEGSTSSASSTASCAPRARAPGTSPSSPAGPHTGRCSTPASASVRSRRASGSDSRSRRSCRISTASCAAGRATSATETRPATSTRSDTTRSTGSRSSWPRATSVRRPGAGGWSSTGQPISSACSTRTEAPSARDRSGAGGNGRMPPVKDVGEPGAGEPHARFDGGREETSASRPRPHGVRRLPPTRPSWTLSTSSTACDRAHRTVGKRPGWLSYVCHMRDRRC